MEASLVRKEKLIQSIRSIERVYTYLTAIVCSNPSFVVTNSSAATPALLTIIRLLV